MNLWQVLQQIRYLLRQVTWTDSPADNVFRSKSVIVSNSNEVRESLLASVSYPVAIISEAGGTPHKEHPLLKEQNIAITVIMRQQGGDGWGETAMLGAQRATTTGSSAHRGLFEVYRPAMEDLAREGRESGLSIYQAGDSNSTTVRIGQGLSLLGKEFRFKVMVHDTEAGYYPDVHGLAVASQGAGTTVSWDAPVARFDLLSGAVTIVRKQNSAPTSAGDGTSVADGSTSTSVNDTPGSGTWHYGAVCKFDEDGTRYSNDIKTTSIVIP